MPVDSYHPQYDRNLRDWTKIRDFLEGESAVKARGETYLPKPTGQDHTDYEAYLKRAPYENAARRTIAGLLGLVFRKPFSRLDVPLRVEKNLSNITLSGVPFDTFVKDVVSETIALGRVGIVVDVSNSGRPYMRLYETEAIRNWREALVGSVKIVDQILVMDTFDVPNPDGFGSKEDTNIREFLLTDDLVYASNVYSKASSSMDYALVESTTPLRMGRALGFIPFVFVGPQNLTPDVERSTVLDLINLLVKHYQLSADLAHALHMVALPTPWVADDVASGEGSPSVFRIGSGVAWKLGTGGQAGMLEVSGEGIGAIQARLEHFELRAAAEGGRILEAQKRAAETAEALRLRAQSESSVLSNLIDTVNLGLTKAMRVYSWWAGATDNLDDPSIIVELNKDFMDDRLSPEETRALVKSWQDMAITKSIMRFNLRRGEMVQEGYTDEQWDLDEKKDFGDFADMPPPMVQTALAVGRPRSPAGEVDASRGLNVGDSDTLQRSREEL